MRSKIIQWLDNNQILIECALVAICLACYFLGQAEAIMMSFTILAIFYFLTGYLPVNVNGLLFTIAYRLVGLASAACTIGLQFHIVGLSGAEEMLRIGAVVVGVCGLILIVALFRLQQTIFVIITARAAILVSIIAALLR